MGRGLSIYNPDSGKIRNATFSSQMPTGITNLRHDRSNNLFACATGGIFMLKDNTFEKIADNTISGEVTNATIFELFFDSSGRSWVGTSKGIFLFDRNVGKLTRNGLPKNFPQNKDVRQMYETTARNLITITDSGEIMVFDENLRQSAHQANLSAINEARGVAQDSNGYAWITSINGLWRYTGSADPVTLRRHGRCGKSELQSRTTNHHPIRRPAAMQYGRIAICQHQDPRRDPDGTQKGISGDYRDR